MHLNDALVVPGLTPTLGAVEIADQENPDLSIRTRGAIDRIGL